MKDYQIRNYVCSNYIFNFESSYLLWYLYTIVRVRYFSHIDLRNGYVTSLRIVKHVDVRTYWSYDKQYGLPVPQAVAMS